ncbi:transporter substrate-binding domain-containing protein [Halomonas sp.]|uniref:ABC transporter substrate-binding protein n=1 Tax=Halomonas sp. TaxID=1486246 RepID=UPI003563E82C
MKRMLMGCLLVAVYLFPAMASAKTYVVGIEPSYPPWASVDSGEYVGIAPDAMRAMAEAQGFDIKFKSIAFSSLIPALKADKIDILATGLTVSPKRATQIDFTIPWWQVQLDVLVKKDSDTNAVTGLCCGAKVGTQTGTTNYAWLQNQLEQKGVDIDIQTYEQGPTGINDLKIGRIDAYFTDDNTATKFAQANPDSIRLAGKLMPHPAQVYALGVKKGNDALRGILNQAVVKIYKSGEWTKIVHRYFPDKAVGKVPTVMPSGIPSYEKPIPGYSQN